MHTWLEFTCSENWIIFRLEIKFAEVDYPDGCKCRPKTGVWCVELDWETVPWEDFDSNTTALWVEITFHLRTWLSTEIQTSYPSLSFAHRNEMHRWIRKSSLVFTLISVLNKTLKAHGRYGWKGTAVSLKKLKFLWVKPYFLCPWTKFK